MSFLRLQLDQYRSRRMDRNDPKTGYAQWQAQRQRASNDNTSLIQQVAYGQSLDSAYKAANKNDSFYFGLNGRILERQESKIPIAGEGAVIFFSAANTVTRPLAKIAPFPFLAINGMFNFTEKIARQRAGL